MSYKDSSVDRNTHALLDSSPSEKLRVERTPITPHWWGKTGRPQEFTHHPAQPNGKLHAQLRILYQDSSYKATKTPGKSCSGLHMHSTRTHSMYHTTAIPHTNKHRHTLWTKYHSFTVKPGAGCQTLSISSFKMQETWWWATNSINTKEY